MQITINTADILGDEATIRDEVISQVSNALITSMRTQAQTALSEMLNKSLNEVVSHVVSEAVNLAVDTEFTEVDSYGRVGKTASVRSRIADRVQEQCTFKQTTYQSDRNPFTAAVQEVISKEVAKFKADFNSMVTRQVLNECMDMAVAKLRESMNIKHK